MTYGSQILVKVEIMVVTQAKVVLAIAGVLTNVLAGIIRIHTLQAGVKHAGILANSLTRIEVVRTRHLSQGGMRWLTTG